jgi:TM2 domain-containing membrane protein YozV
MVVRLKRCPKCLRNDVPREIEVCHTCGYVFEFRQAPPPEVPPELPQTARWVEPAPHDISIATLASLFVIGTGQMYNHQSGKGVILFCLSFVLLSLTVLLRSLDLFGLSLIVWGVSMADAAVIAGRLLNHQQVTRWQWF